MDELNTDKRGPGRPRKPVELTSRRSIALAKRLAPGGNVFGSGSKSVPMREAGWKQKWFNGDYYPGRLHEARHEKGWVPVTPDDLGVPIEELGFSVNALGHIARGARGEEVLFKMDARDYHEVSIRKTEANNREIGRPENTKSVLANAAAATHGDEAGQFVHDHFVGTVKDQIAPLA